MDRIVTETQLRWAARGARVHLEFVASASNWSDGASRALEHDEFLRLARFAGQRVSTFSLLSVLAD